MNLKFKIFTNATIILSVCIYSLNVNAEWFSDEQAIMGTAVSVTLWQDDKAEADAAIGAVMDEMRRVDQWLSPYIETSELAQINREAAKSTVTISKDLAEIIDKALYYSRLSDGAFDISFASVGRFYDYREQQKPADAQRQALLEAIDYHLIEFDKQHSTLHFNHPELKIDLGGIAKGYAVDKAIALLYARGIRNASVSAGGDSRLLGDRGNNKPWHVGIKNPRGDRRATEVAIMLPLANVAVSTSGDYERFFIDNETGERVHHILNPRTGQSTHGVASVTILGPQGFDTDPLSTTVFVLGVEKGLPLINRLPGFDAIIIDSAGNVHYSEGLTPPVQTTEN